jgi:hypothetical protein
VLVAHACNASYSGSRDQEDRGSKPAWANSSRDPIKKNTHHKKGLVEWLKVKALNSSPSTIKCMCLLSTSCSQTESWTEEETSWHGSTC